MSLKKLKEAWIIWLAGKLPPCAEIVRFSSESFERKLTLRESIQMRLHFLICEWCERYMHQARLLREALHHHPEDADAVAPARLSSEARARIQSSLSDQLR